MIIQNRIIFGHGTVIVGANNIPAAIHFASSDTAHPVGDVFAPDSEQSPPIISILLNLARHRELTDNLRRVEQREASSFSFCGYIFNFTNYNPESIHVIREKAFEALSHYLAVAIC